MFSIGRFEVNSRRERFLVAMAAPWLIHVASWCFRFLGAARPQVGAAFSSMWARAVCSVLRIDAEIIGRDRLPDGPAILLPLHEGFADVPLMMRLGRSLRFIAREELFEWPQLGRVLSAGHHVVLPMNPDRGELRALMRDSIDVLNAGHDLVVFPQGSILGIEVAFDHGAKRLAAAAGVPVVPIVITGTHRVWEHPYSNRLRRGVKTRLEVLDPIDHADVSDRWRETETRMKDIALAQQTAPPRRFEPTRDGYWDGYRYEIDPRFAGLSEDVAQHRFQQSLAEQVR